jgi:hypothetical protein
MFRFRTPDDRLEPVTPALPEAMQPHIFRAIEGVVLLLGYLAWRIAFSGARR